MTGMLPGGLGRQQQYQATGEWALGRPLLSFMFCFVLFLFIHFATDSNSKVNQAGQNLLNICMLPLWTFPKAHK
jgi:hypothetical protein